MVTLLAMLRVAWVKLALLLCLGPTQIWAAAGRSVQTSLWSSVGRQLDPDLPQTSFSLEPWLTIPLASQSLWRLRTLLDRSFDPYQPLRVPFIDALGLFSLTPRWGLFSQTSGQDVHEWKTEGIQIRQATGFFVRTPLGAWTIEASVGPFFSVTEYAQRRNGDPFSKAGALEQITIAWEWRALKLEVLGLLVQDWNGRWRNLYSTFQRVTIRLLETVAIGITHQLFRSHVDEATGALQPIGIFDGRKSRISGFIRWQL